MSLCSASVVNNSNSKVLRIRALAEDVSISTPERLYRIALVVAEWDSETAGSVERHRVARKVSKS
jgi:hypothetical protein